MRPDGGEMLGAGVAQAVGDARRRGVQRSHRRILGIEQAQDVAVEALLLDRRQGRPMRVEVRRQLGDVGRPAGGVTDRVQQDLDALEAGIAEDPHPELDDLGVDRRARIADRLDVELPELAEPAGLRPVVAEHRPGHRELDRLRPGVHPVLEVRADDASGRLGPERPRFGLLGSRRDPEELLLDDVGDLADAALEDVGLLEHRRRDLPVAVAGGEVRRQPLETVPGGPVGGQQVAGAPWGAWGRHRARSVPTRPARRRVTGRRRGRSTVESAHRHDARRWSLRDRLRSHPTIVPP